jgi:hypothetical protein
VIARLIALGLVAVHAGLGLWAAIGFAELIVVEVPWGRLSNPLFSRPMLLAQWTLIAIAAAAFITAYFGRWRSMPELMAAIYGAMALLCAYQTFFVLTHQARFRAMAIEYLQYALILVFLFSSEHVRQHLGRPR